MNNITEIYKGCSWKTNIIDCKTRWSSLLLILEQIYQVKNCVQKALIDIYPVQDNSIGLSHDEVIIFSEIITALVPIKAKVL